MHKLLDITEDSVRDLNMHYSGAVLYDREQGLYMLINEFGGNSDEVRIHYQDSKKEDKVAKYSLEDLLKNVKAISLYDGYINLNGYCMYLQREIDRKYKKTTTLNNTQVFPLGTAFIRANDTRVKRSLDAYTVLKAMQQRYYPFHEALKKTEQMFSVAMSRELALVKQPVKEGESPLHVVYNSVYIGKVQGCMIEFKDHELHELVIDQLKEVGYEAA